MTRIAIDLPSYWLFQTELSVQIGDINYGNHLANDAVLRLCHEARLRFLTTLGYSEMNTAGYGLILAEAAMQFQKQGFYGDQLNIKIGMSQITKIGFTLIYQLTRIPDQSTLATVQTNMVFFDYAAQQVRKTPAEFRLTIQKLYPHD
ncbi:thioesterase family protein [Neisseriaceae bacterium ESL0693]|nr:thioesterase family protein [Neisseriaceae bacterium ESL0693]